MANNEKMMENIKNLERVNDNSKLEKIIIVTSKGLTGMSKKYDIGTQTSYQDDSEVSGKLVFLADKVKFNEWKCWMKEVGQWDNVDEVYIYDRYHKNGDDMIKRATQKLHKYSYAITLKPEYKECWFNGEVTGCKLWYEFGLDPHNIRW